MNIFLTLRTFVALFLLTLGIGLIFVRSEDQRIMLGAFLSAAGLTFMVRMAIELRQK